MSSSPTAPLLPEEPVTNGSHVSEPSHNKTRTSSTPQHKPSIFVRSIQALFGFRKTSLTLLSLITIFIVIASIPLAKHRGLSLPEDDPVILSSSWLDLQTISKKPHTYISRANDEVHDYILSRVRALSKSSSFITVADDTEEDLHLFKIRKSWWNATSEYSPLHYYESNNILVKIEGQEPALEGVLLSAHYDSVPTGFGSTDDGAGIASLLGILEHYATTGDRPIRSIVFNFNNNEEFGLFGADAFFEHPWSKLVKYFINLEGTGTGAERAVLFRTTDYAIGKFYQKVRSPFATSIFQEGFASGLVHSETDYRVYASNGLRGFDIAFYNPRSLYHTSFDSIKYTSKNALWHMLSNTLDLTVFLSNTAIIEDDIETQAIFFDVLGLAFVAVPSTFLYTINIILLISVPLILLVLGLIIHKRNIWSIGFSWIILPISLVIAGLSAKFLLKVIFYFNPFIVSRNFFAPLLATTSTFLFWNYLILTFFQYLWPVHDLKLLITLEIFFGLWSLLLFSTIRQSSSSIYTGEYNFTIYYALYSISTILGLFGISVASPRKKLVKPTPVSYGSIQEAHSPIIIEVDPEAEIETAPLLPNSLQTQPEAEQINPIIEVIEEGHPEHNSFTYDWSLQFLIVVPINLLLTWISVWLILEGINQTAQESLESHYFVFSVIFIASIAISVPFLSFAYKLNFLFGLLLVITIISGTTISLFEAPFSIEAPLKLRFAQTINLDTTTPVSTVELFGRQGQLDFLHELPSIKQNDVLISCESKPDGNELCTYPAARPYLLDGTSKQNDYINYLNVNILKSGSETSPSPYTPLTAEISINASNNRFCSLSFNSTTYKSGEYGKSPLRIFTYYHDKLTNKSQELAYATIPSGPSKDADGNEVFKWLQGIDEVHLHKLNWDQDSYHIGLQWIPKWLEDGEEQEPSNSPNNKLGIQISCYWGEYDDVSIVDGEALRKVPAYDELLEYSPLTISFSNRYEGLIKIEKYLVI